MNSPGGVRLVAVALLFLVCPARSVAQPVIGVLGITREIAPVEKRLEGSREVTVRGFVFRTGTLNGRQVVVGRSAAGKVNAALITTVLIGEFNPSAVLFSGTAGGIDPSLRPGDVVIGTTLAQHDVGLLAPDGIRRRGTRNAVTGEFDPLLVPAPESLLAVARRSAQGLRLRPVRTPDGEERAPRIVEGVIVTGDVFVADPASRGELRDTLGATAVEMEGAAFVQTCRQFRVPCLVIRSITDQADGRAANSYEQFLSIASEHAATLVAAIVAGLKDVVW